MTAHLTCFHGHALETAALVGQTLICPMCGSVSQLKKGEGTQIPEVIAPTLVPASIVDPSALGGTPPGLVGNASDGLVPATSDFDPSDIISEKSKIDRAATTPRLPTEKHASSREHDFQPPRLDGYEIMEELGRGGMGVVYHAFDERHRRDVALKTLQRMGPDDLVRFKQEFRALADIAHPNLVSLYELLSDGKTWCFTMEILKGVGFLDYIWSEFESLKLRGDQRRKAEVVTEGPRLSMRRLNRLFEALKQLAVGLNQLHRADKLHSDIKPSNVLVTNDQRVVLLDFGLIAEINRDEKGRVPRVIQGTPHYMSPEQAACAPLTEASDWYAVGVMLYEVLTGRLPIRDKSVRIMLRKQYETPVEPAQRQEGIPPELNELCMALLEKDPRNRPGAADVLRAVDAEDLAIGIEETRQTISAKSVKLVGREKQFEVLRNEYEEVQGGDTRSVFVHGFSGMGKSTLIREFLDSIDAQSDAVVLEGRCYEQESVPFKALDSLIDALVVYLSDLPVKDVRALMPEDIAPLTRLFPVLAQVPGAADAKGQTIDNADQNELRQRASDGLRELLVRLGRRQPIVLFIDDLQWGDEDSSNLLAELMRPSDGPRLLLLGSYRREDIEASPSLIALADAYQKGNPKPSRCELPVEPLSVDDATRLAEMLLGRSDRATKRFASRIGQESGGSPFFVWELAQHVQEDSSPTGASLELDEVIWTRVNRLPAETRLLLEVFAVAGRPMRASEAYQTIDEVTHGPGLLAQLRTSNFVRTTEQEDDTIVETYHDRIRESVVNHLANARVRGHHLKLALAIEQASNIRVADIEAHLASTPDFDEPAAPYSLDKRQWQRVFDLAYFYHAAEKSDRALPYALAAAEQAWSQNALDVAEQQFEIARRGSEMSNDAVRFRIAEGLGNVLMMRGKYDQANLQFQAARALAKEHVTFARIDGKRGYLCFKKGDMGNAAEYFETALKELGDPPPSNSFLQAVALTKEAISQILHTYLPSWFVARRAEDHPQRERDLFRARLHDGLGYPYWFTRGPIPTLWTHLRHMNLAERYPATQELGRAYSMQAVIMTAIPLAARGVAYADKSYAIHGEFGDRLGQGKARSFQTFSHLALGRFREGAETGREAVRLLEQAGDVWEENMARIILSQPLYFLGELEEAERVASRSFEIGVETGDYSAMAIALYFWVTSNAHALPQGALQIERDREREDPLSAAAASQGRGLELLLREDDPAAAVEVLQESLDVAKQRGLRNPAIFCGVSWKATAARLVAERESDGPAKQRALKEAKRAARSALSITKSYLTCRARALREWAMIAVLEGRASVARRYFDESLQVAERQEARYEHATSLLARAEAGLKFGWAETEPDSAAARKTIAEIEGFQDGKNRALDPATT